MRYLRDWLTEMYERQEATARSDEWIAGFATELEGVRFALDDALARFEVIAGAELLAAIERAWIARGFAREGIVRIEAFISALPGDEVLLLAKLSATLSSLFAFQGMFARALAVATDACAYARRSTDGPAVALALRAYARANTQLHNFADADAALNEAAAIPSLSAAMRSTLTEARLHLSDLSGDLEAAARGYEQRIAEQRALGSVRNVHAAAINLAGIEHARGRTDRAIALVHDVLPALRTESDPVLCANMLANLAGYLAARGDLSGAMEAALEAIEKLARDPDHFLVAAALEHLALVDALQGRFARAVRLATYADSAFAKMGTKREFTERTTYDRLTAVLAEKLTC
ncbi:MAG: hypothetical protein IAI49_16660, partial [Candidatus Eremiobacteraeota bacterium]|nr:hypothetical protein [Candidatus Eremiobacteraeota bacterium]